MNLNSHTVESTSIKESVPNQNKNRCPTGPERQALIKSVKSEQDEIARISDEKKGNDNQVTRHLATITYYEECLEIVRVLINSTETKITANLQISELFSGLTPRSTSDLTQIEDTGAASLLESLKRYHTSCEENGKDLEDLTLTLRGLESHRSSIQTNIEATHSILTRLRYRNETLVTSEDAIKKNLRYKLLLLSAIRCIPPEIWGEIFSIYIEDTEQQFRLGPRIGTPPFAALTLSAVCRSWRQTAFQHPELWQHVAISGIRDNPERIRHYLLNLGDRPPILYTYSRYALEFNSPGEMLLRAYTFAFGRPPNANARWWPRFSEFTHELISKCKSLDIVLDIPLIVHGNVLEYLDLEIDELLLQERVKQSTSTIRAHKQWIQDVKSITCHRVQLHLEDNFLPPTQQPSAKGGLKLETISFVDSNLQYSSLINLCKEAPRLTHLDFRMSNLVYDIPLVTDISLPSMKKISLSSIHLRVLNSISIVPCLEEVDLICQKHADRAWKEFINVPSKSRAIQVLTLRSGILDRDSGSFQSLKKSYEYILLSLPNLRCLHLYDEPGGSDLPLTSRILGHLQSLVLHHSNVHATIIAVLLTEAYRERKGPISLTFDFCKNIGPLDVEYLAGLRP
ncbi:hypothetical protein FRC17_000609 [Serendipita sp. 399]|nr:hypothetical protein FRC17_000609 [Serendipita sp. 399]